MKPRKAVLQALATATGLRTMSDHRGRRRRRRPGASPLGPPSNRWAPAARLGLARLGHRGQGHSVGREASEGSAGVWGVEPVAGMLGRMPNRAVSTARQTRLEKWGWRRCRRRDVVIQGETPNMAVTTAWQTR